jgi:primosomal protein N' (replication factor Y)
LQTYADIVFPTAVRQAFTYAVPSALEANIKPGKRVWVPFQQRKTIGMVVHVHDKKPSFNTKGVKRLLDETPILSRQLLELTHWTHRFYYCGWGEVVQAALPAGLNFYADKYLYATSEADARNFEPKEKEIVEAAREADGYLYDEALKRWDNAPFKNTLQSLIENNMLEIREEPVQKMQPQTQKEWSWSPEWTDKEINNLLDEYESEGKTYKWLQALALLLDLGLPQTQKTLKEYDLLSYYSLNRIAEEGIIEAEDVEVTGFDLDLNHEPEQIKKLNDEQEQAFQRIAEPMDAGRYESFLLYGITGSGKTEVYIHALKKALDAGKGGLILVPEISLTPQTVERFYQIFGDDIAVLHSGLSKQERYRAWNALRSGDKRIAIGARSAVFAPVQNLGLLVVDEEHDSSYKQHNPAPRYHAREVAIMRGYKSDAVVIMGSATPSMQSLYASKKEKSTMLKLTKRHKNAALPEVEVIDLKQYRSAMRGPLAIPLHEAIGKALEAEEQIILLQNRRGFSSYLQCENCGHLPECPNCSVSLTYHKRNNHLRCHYCGYSAKVSSHCAECGSPEITKKGTGTQQVEEQIKDLFPEAAVCRMDRDTTTARDSHQKILGRFDRGQIDILLGTQLVAKGLDFPNVTVVGVINADTELAFPSFRAGERMYQLLSQVAGRSGRAEKAGRVYLQTWQPDHYAIGCAQQHDHRAFARHEMNERKLLDYPPYARLIKFQFKAKKAPRIEKVAHTFTQCLRELAEDRPVLGPSPSTITKMQGWIRWECLIKFETDTTAQKIDHFLSRVFTHYESKKPKGASSVRINVNVDALE